MISGAIGMRGHVDHPQPRLAQQHQQEQEALLHRPGSCSRCDATARSSVIEGMTTTDSSSWLSRIASQTPAIRACSSSKRSVPLLLGQLGQHVGSATGAVQRSPVMTRSVRCRRP